MKSPLAQWIADCGQGAGIADCLRMGFSEAELCAGLGLTPQELKTKLILWWMYDGSVNGAANDPCYEVRLEAQS